MTTRTNDSREGATITTVANIFHAQLSNPDAGARTDLLNTIREQNLAAQSRNMPSDLPGFFLKDDGAGDKFPAMKDVMAQHDNDLGAAKGRRSSEAEPTGNLAQQEVARPAEVAQVPQAGQRQEFDVIRL
jgi:hypothetical protein